MPNLAIWVGDSVTNVQMALYCAVCVELTFRAIVVVVHHVDGHLTAKAKNQIAFLASKEDESDTSSKYGPETTLVLQNVTTSELWEQFNRTFDAARCEDVFKAFQGRIWKDLIYSCCLNVVENGVKLYKIRMSEGLGTIINTPDLKGVTQALSPAKKVEN
ncbi:unnamed protein product [Peronospora farinosa]|uniref:Uncharacterized protein n=1 Tax=Peronospora farinosa TaxID=134698 RepID=A0AAV0T4L4_9STRA|nr:unnamed protein product [Peronospora farinosa]